MLNVSARLIPMHILRNSLNKFKKQMYISLNKEIYSDNCKVKCCSKTDSKPAILKNKIDQHALYMNGIKINHISSINEFTNSLASNLHSLTNSQLVAAVEMFDRLIYDQISTYQWAIKDHETMLFVQSNINSECQILFQNLTKNELFNEICQKILCNSSTLSNYELLSAVKYLLHLHIPPDSHLISPLIYLCIQKIRTYTLEDLCILSDVANYMRRSGFALNSVIVKNLQDIIGDNGITKEMYDSIAHILLNVNYFCSEEYVSRLLEKATRLLLVNDDVDVKSSVYYLESYRNNIHSPNNCSPLAFLKNIINNIGHLPMWHLSRVPLFCKKYDYVNGTSVQDDIKNTIITRALEILKTNDLNAADVFVLSSIFDFFRASDNNLLININELLGKTVIYFDPFLLKHFSKQKAILKKQDDKLIWLFQESVQSKISDLFSSLACVMDIIRFLLKCKESSEELNKSMCNFLLDHIQNKGFGTNPEHLSLIGSYLLKHQSLIRHSLPILIKLLADMSPQFSLKQLLRLKKQTMIHRSKIQMSSFFCSQIYHLQSCLISSIINYIQEINSLEDLNECIEDMHLNKKIKYEICFLEHLSDVYKNLVNQIDVKNVNATSKNIARLQLYIPEILQSVYDIMIENIDLLDVEMVDNILYALATVNYVPANCNNLESIVVNLWKKNNITEENISYLFNTLYSLVILDVFPEELLLRIFNIEFLLRFDSMCKDLDFKTVRHLRRQLLRLNRSVLIACPELNLPWFHEERNFEATNINFLKDEIKECLAIILERKDCIKSNIRSDYGHWIDFECSLNKYQIPICITSEEYYKQQDAIRIAIRVLFSSAYCSNNPKHLLGTAALTLQELEILGYKVVQIPYFEFQSMMLNDKVFKLNYIKKKIFQ